MPVWARAAIALVLFSLSLVLVATQAPAPGGRIEGVVLQAGGASPQPVAGARITVTRVNGATGAALLVPGRTAGTSINTDFGNARFPGMPEPGQRGALPPPALPGPPQQTALPIPPVTTGRDGGFVVPDLEEGSYRVLITQNGYVRQEFGQRVFPGQGTLINLGAGQVLRNLTIHLTPTGNVGGRLIDNNGQPAVGVNLQLLKAIYSSFGQRVFQNAGSARSNDRGEYRFFWVTPGRYYVAGGSSSASFTFGVSNTSPNESGDSYLLTYYPGVTDISRATPVDVKSGSEMALDFVTPRQQLYTISGRVVDPNPVAAAAGTIPAVTLSLAFQLLTGGAGTFTMNQAYDPATGIFVMRDVLPGSYVLQAAAPPSSARVAVEVVNSNVEGLVVTLDNGVNINGRFVVEGGEMPPSNTLRVQMRLMTNGLQNWVGALPASSPAAADGSFTIPSVIQGQYRVTVPPALEFYVKELRYDRADALNSPIDVSRRNSDSGTMEVVISRSVGQVDGVIADDRGQPVPGVQSVLVPDNRGRVDLYKTATTDQGGRFVIRGITPGDYKLFAWEALENYGYFDPDVIRRSESFGKAVRVAESSRLSVEGKIIPANQ
jgi:hypothetical protein